ncbi:hypothetical protein SUGI_0123300 [Cryptomeria japonica]|nr:hypothetical protein SUGI_0123300 [Cryptomeria japonica]
MQIHYESGLLPFKEAKGGNSPWGGLLCAKAKTTFGHGTLLQCTLKILKINPVWFYLFGLRDLGGDYLDQEWGKTHPKHESVFKWIFPTNTQGN